MRAELSSLLADLWAVIRWVCRSRKAVAVLVAAAAGVLVKLAAGLGLPISPEDASEIARELLAAGLGLAALQAHEDAAEKRAPPATPEA